MGLEATVTNVADLNSAWPLSTDPKTDGDNHLRFIKVALKSLLTNPGQILPSFADAEVLTGSGYGTSLTLAYAPSPVGSLILTKDGVVLEQGVGYDYSLTGANIQLAIEVQYSAHRFRAWYRY